MSGMSSTVLLVALGSRNLLVLFRTIPNVSTYSRGIKEKFSHRRPGEYYAP
jgi:hypothetical protein